MQDSGGLRRTEQAGVEITKMSCRDKTQRHWDSIAYIRQRLSEMGEFNMYIRTFDESVQLVHQCHNGSESLSYVT